MRREGIEARDQEKISKASQGGFAIENIIHSLQRKKNEVLELIVTAHTEQFHLAFQGPWPLLWWPAVELSMAVTMAMAVTVAVTMTMAVSVTVAILLHMLLLKLQLTLVLLL